MHSETQISKFHKLRANGWSLGKIAQHLGISKSTIYEWDRQRVNREVIHSLKAMHVERLQELHLPSYEEDLQKFAMILSRVEAALDNLDFKAMKPEFLL